MEELDYEDVLLIHPDEDIKKMESIEIDANSNLEEAIEIDTHSNLEEDIEIDVHSNLEEAIDIDTNSNLEEAIEIDVSSNLKKIIETDNISNSDGAVATGAISNLDHASDSGEIDDEEEANDLEEGEIKESGAMVKKKSEIACRFFKRGSCVFGSQCQYLHVSNTVYKMFDTNPPKRNDLQPVGHQNFIKPIIFPSNVLPPRPFIEPPISVTPKPDFHRQYDTIEDNWEKGLEQARILIQKKANFKKRNDDSEPNKFSSKNSKGEKTKGENFTRTNNGSELLYSNSKKYCDKAFGNNSLRRVDSFDEKKSNYRYQPKSDDKWVDPWRRSKSPDSKSRHRSPSSSPLSRSRKRSYASSISSSSSSSSEFDAIYERSYKKKSPVGRGVSKSRSNSQPKKQRFSPKRSINGRKNSLSSSRSFSRSPKRKRKSRSLSRSSTSSSSCSEYETNLTAEDKEFKRISAKLNEQLYHKSPKRASPSLYSDCETSELTVSSASCTTISSDSESDSYHHSPLRSKQSPIQNNITSYSNKLTGPANTKVFSKKEPVKSRDMIQHKDDATSVQRKMLPSNRGKNQNNWGLKTDSTGCKPKNAASSFNSVKKPNTEFSKNKKSHDMNLLFMYQDLMHSNKNKNDMPNPTNVKPNNCAVKPNKTSTAVKEVSKTNINSEKQKISKVPTHDMDMLCMYQDLGNYNKNSNNVQNAETSGPALKSSKDNDAVLCANKTDNNSESGHKISKISNVPRQNIVLNLQPKSKSYTKPEMFNKPQADETVTIKKKVSMSKREQLLNKLKLIDDAIARKKNK